MAQCGPGGQLTADFTKMQGMGPMGGGPMEMGMHDNDMGMMGDMPPPPEMQMMQHEFQQMALGGAPSAMATAVPMTAPSASAAYAEPQVMGGGMPMGAMMHNPMMGMGMMGPMMGGPMMGGPQLMYPYQMQMQQAAFQQQQQQKPVVASASAAQVNAPLPQIPLPQIPTLEAMLAQPLDEGAWMKQFQTEGAPKTAEEQQGVQTLGNEGEDLRTVEDKTSDSQFYNFMQKVNDGRVVIDEENAVVTEVDRPAATDDWAAQLAAAQAQVDEAYGTQMANHVPDAATEAWRANEADADAYKDDVDHYGAEEFYDAEMDGEAWANEYKELLGRFADAQNATDYPFEPENAFLFHDDPLSEGKQLLALGILSDAVLAFEAACQKDMENVEAWKLLGTTQAENEKDMLAIRALNKAKQLNPRDREVYMALSVSHANESNNAFALESLRGWLLCQPEYEVLVDVVSAQTKEAEALNGGSASAEDDYTEFLGMMASPKEMQELTTLFGAAIEMNPQDASLHVALGIAHHISHDFESAVGCFKAAVDADPNDPKVWNKLGATLANSSKSTEAIQMYERALDLNPGYVRARYNMGIAYNNLGQHELAAQHFARAIVMQQGGAGDGSEGNGHSRSTREMWDALRMALNFTNRSDLVQHTWKQDIKPILDEFGLSDLAF